ncbi:hypothetical protein SAMN04487897_1608 [Paenibacillus sp. yr247]|uniref:hypothetical protein n=1 Tax=Paenibacillus sp. yr247 TaxID=1761880 RepID=UPI00088827AF|nr:hypothetical protein [Paenibacillus sp. yr247]SDP26730.1 hypothetical protein SAMN04487897_1608 [Paenibacillus sp. yr247]
MSKLMIKWIVFLIILMIIGSYPIIVKINENIDYTKGLQTAISNYYIDNCNAEILSIDLTVPLIQVSNFMHIGGREQTWSANINLKDHFGGHYGNKIITLIDPKCTKNNNTPEIFMEPLAT